jgi:hypothetical protein
MDKMTKHVLLHILFMSFVFILIPTTLSTDVEKDRLLAIPLRTLSGIKKDEATLLSELLPVELHRCGASSINLRSSYRDLSLSQVQSMSNMSIRSKGDWGFYGHSTISHSYSQKSIGGDNVVTDNATGLMWHQNGSDEYVSWNKSKDWVGSLNSRGYAGYNDWRLPTVEEAATLLESSRSNDRYIDPIFSDKQGCIWTGDSKNGSEAAWSVYFCYGDVSWSYIISINYVRPVRSIE